MSAPGIPFDWRRFETILLDMDGTLLDLHFDNHFWQQHVPLRFAEKRGMSLEGAHAELKARYHVHSGTLKWYSVDFWESELGLDIMRLKHEVAHLIAVHPHVTDFLGAIRAAGKRIVLVTNAHHKSLTLKMSRTGLRSLFDAIYTSHEIGLPKEDPSFWDSLCKIEPFDPARTLLIDDSLPVLDSAQTFGIAGLIAITRPDTRQPAKDTGGYLAIESFRDLVLTLGQGEVAST